VACILTGIGDLSKGVYDELGHRYEIPPFCLANPLNMVEEPVAGIGETQLQSEGDDGQVHDDIRITSDEGADHLGKGKMPERAGREFTLKARLSDRGGPDVYVKFKEYESVKKIADKIAEKAQVCVFFKGRRVLVLLIWGWRIVDGKCQDFNFVSWESVSAIFFIFPVFIFNINFVFFEIDLKTTRHYYPRDGKREMWLMLLFGQRWSDSFFFPPFIYFFFLTVIVFILWGMELWCFFFFFFFILFFLPACKPFFPRIYWMGLVGLFFAIFCFLWLGINVWFHLSEFCLNKSAVAIVQRPRAHLPNEILLCETLVSFSVCPEPKKVFSFTNKGEGE
jgi:hypothetical protein